MKHLNEYESNEQLGEFDEKTQTYPDSPFEKIVAALKKRGIRARQRIRDNQPLALVKLGDYRYSGGGFVILVPDNFPKKGELG
jgi:hypothetical protein